MEKTRLHIVIGKPKKKDFVMKTLVTNRKITVSILMVIVLLCIAQSTSHAGIVSVKPGDDDTSLVVKFTFSYRRDSSGYYSKSFVFSWRQKSPQGEWESARKRYSVSWFFYVVPINTDTATREYTIEDLIPDTTYEVRVDSGTIHEGTTNHIPLSISSAPPLTEANLDKSVVTLTLRYDDTYETDVTKIRDSVAVSGINGVTVNTATVQRLSDTEITVELDFDGTDFDTEATLAFTVASGAIANQTDNDFTVEIPVPAIKESVSASVVSPLTEANLDGSTVTIILSGGTYEQDITTITGAVSVTGISGVTIDTTTLQRISDRKITGDLDYDDTDFDVDTALTLSIASDAVANYIGKAITTKKAVTAIREGLSVSAVSPLTEANLDGSTVTLTLTDVSFQQDISTISGALTVSDVSGVALNTNTVERISDTEITVELDFDGTDFDMDTELTFNIHETALTGNIAKAELTAGIPVTAVKEIISASVISPLTEATLDGSIITLLLTGAAFEQDISKIRDAVTVSGIDGVTVDTATVKRLSDRRVSVELIFDGTDFDTDTTLTFSVIAGGITNYKGTALTTEVIVTPGREEQVSIFWGDGDSIKKAGIDDSNVQTLVTGLSDLQGIALDVAGGKIYWTDYGRYWNDPKKIQRANLDGSNIEDLITQGSKNHPNSIALDVEGGKMYWTDSATDKIQRANLDGSNIEDLITDLSGNPRSITLDVTDGKMYWTNGTKIQRANLDGSNIEDIVTGLPDLQGIALDVAGGKIYWTDHGRSRSAPKKIQRANLDGSNIEDLITQGLENQPNSIALDVEGGKMYWTHHGSSWTRILRKSSVRTWMGQT